jgi:hypothetical protein
MGEERGVHRVLVWKPEGKRPLGRPRRRWEDNIKMDVEEVGGGRGDWIEFAQEKDRCSYSFLSQYYLIRTSGPNPRTHKQN